MIASTLFHDVNLVANVAGLLILCGGILAYSRLKSALEAVGVSAQAWQSERNAEKAKAERLQEELHTATAEITKLRTQPDITKLYTLMERHDERMNKIGTDLIVSLDKIVGRLESLEAHNHPHAA